MNAPILSAPLRLALVCMAGLVLSLPAQAQGTPRDPVREQQKQAIRQQQSAAPGGLGSMNSKEPIKIDADRLDVFDKESRAVFAGNVVAVQGETTVRCSVMTLFYEPRGQGRQAGAATQTAPQPAPQPAAARQAGAPNDGAIRRIECTGPVTVISKTQTATGDNAVFDRVSNKVILTGNVALADGQNITRGEKLIYDTQTGVANVETKPGGRVKGLFIPGSGAPAGGAPAAGQPAPRPRAVAPTPTN
ncbi:MAG: LptA/OstA family protein [Bosea sp. (in: a-proteobacteria)]